MDHRKEGTGLPGEFEVIRRIGHALPDTDPSVLLGVGDDAAAVAPAPGMTTLLTTDTFVEGVDFDVAFSSWRQIGWKCMAANFSDIAAMGGVPRHALTTLCLPAHRAMEDVEALYLGFRDLAGHVGHPVSIVGGDLSSTDGPTVISITVSGEAAEEHITRRSGARAGDILCVTGLLGASETGLRLLRAAREQPAAENPAMEETAAQGRTVQPASNQPTDRFEGVLRRHRTPVPRVREGVLLANSGWVRAMIDVSDGLSSDVLHVGRDSGVGLNLDGNALPIAEETRRAMEELRLDPVGTALESGEEFELLCAVAPEGVERLAAELAERTGTPLTPIGECVTAARRYTITDHTGSRPLRPKGYEHFSG
ncbi:MAG: thiamine-phosphate kinase [Gemmatimonadetes bacterium]|nr:thiamine-phosphate kinase [Gemmatimonadota bacterium]MYG85837.1 thiamine-phosphate kinase [Gemmatimonadota bacterium]MYJ89747.1 thiamine-phosphate kinase [Gemmatimonadota bacterium]